MDKHLRSVLCRYRYDPLDRTSEQLRGDQQGVRHCYQGERLACEVNGQDSRTVLWAGDAAVAEHWNQPGSIELALLQTDLASVPSG
ncbi:hypothetical protein D3C76_409080 [compost metagenome]